MVETFSLTWDVETNSYQLTPFIEAQSFIQVMTHVNDSQENSFRFLMKKFKARYSPLNSWGFCR